jgi:hypothetical protein
MRHVRINGCDSGGHCDHCLKRVAILGEHRAPRFDRSRVRRSDDAAGMSGSVEIHGRVPSLRPSARAGLQNDNPGKFPVLRVERTG